MIDEKIDERQLECEKRHNGCRTCPFIKIVKGAFVYPCATSKAAIEARLNPERGLKAEKYTERDLFEHFDRKFHLVGNCWIIAEAQNLYDKYKKKRRCWPDFEKARLSAKSERDRRRLLFILRGRNLV